MKKTPNTITKAATLLLFAGLLSLFVAYRCGTFGKRDKPAETESQGDSLKLHDEIIPSSKSGIIVPPPQDNGEQEEDPAPNQPPELVIPSSKSAIILDDLKELLPEDSLKQQK